MGRISPDPTRWPPGAKTRLVPAKSNLKPHLSIASDAPVRAVFLSYSLCCPGRSSPCTGFTPGRSSPGASAMLPSAPDAPIRGVFLSYSLRCLGRSSPWHRVHPRTIESGGLRRASFPPWLLQSGASFCHIRSAASDAPVRGTGSAPDDSVRGLAPCFSPPRLLQSGGSFCHILSAVSDAPVRGIGFNPGQSCPGACAVLHSSPVASIRGVFLSYSLRCLGRSSPWHRVHPRTIQSGGLRRASLLPGCSNPRGLFVVLPLPPRTLQSVAPGSPPDDPVRGLMLCFIPPR